MIEFVPRKVTGIYHTEVYVDGKPLDMGDGAAELIDLVCKKHGKTKGLLGFNQGGYDSLEVCLECCKEVMDFVLEERVSGRMV